MSPTGDIVCHRVWDHRHPTYPNHESTLFDKARGDDEANGYYAANPGGADQLTISRLHPERMGDDKMLSHVAQPLLRALLKPTE